MKNKYALYYTLNKNLDFEFTENIESELIEKVNSCGYEQQKIIFRLIFEYFNNKVEVERSDTKKKNSKIKEENIELPKWIVKEVEVGREEDIYKINLNDLDSAIKKIIWKFLNLKVKN